MTFGSSSSLERIGAYCFLDTTIAEVRIPDSVRELCDGCFQRCESLRRVTFGSSSSLERIGAYSFGRTTIEEVRIPDSVCELCDCCFQGCKSLCRVMFGSLSSLERIGTRCFVGCGLIEFKIPDTVEAIGCGAFGLCPLSGGFVCGDGCRFCAFDGLVLSLDCERCFCSYGILLSVCIPDSVRELCDGCFQWRWSLSRVTFGSSSSLERIGAACFEGSGVEEISIPNSVRELCHGCFQRCKSLRRVNFGSSSSLERICA